MKDSTIGRDVNQNTTYIAQNIEQLFVIHPPKSKLANDRIERNREPQEVEAAFAKELIKYGKNLASRYGKLKILNMSRPIELSALYTRVNVLERITARSKTTLELLEEQAKRQGHFGSVIKARAGIEVINEKNIKTNKFHNIIVLGKPGAGKTTFLRHITLQALQGEKGELQRSVLPILIELRDLSSSTKSLLDFITEQFDICGIANRRKHIEGLLKAGKCLVLLDGLDEVKTGKVEEIVKEVKNLVNKYHNNQFILSCRIAAYNYVFEQFMGSCSNSVV